MPLCEVALRTDRKRATRVRTARYIGSGERPSFIRGSTRLEETGTRGPKVVSGRTGNSLTEVVGEKS